MGGNDTVWYALFFCVGGAVGVAVVWQVFAARAERAKTRANRLHQELDALRRQFDELTVGTAEVLDATARQIDTGARVAAQSFGEQTLARESLWSVLEPLGGEQSPDPEQVDRVARKAENAAATASSGARALSSEATNLSRAAGFLTELAATLENASDDRDRLSQVTESARDTVAAATSMDDATRRVRDGATETQTLSARVSAEAERGYKAVHETLDEIERIRDVTESARLQINALGERVHGIGDVVRVIQEITEKTNLLALNASIIAAQAGQHGKSFAVVAREIKALANRTAASTKEISDAIRGVQEESEKATAAIGEGAAAVNHGFQVAIAAGDALGAIRDGARDAQKRVQSMGRAFNQQASASKQVIDLASRVADRAQVLAQSLRNSQTAERLSAAAGEVSASVGRITDLVAKQRKASTVCSDAFSELLAEVANITQIERDLRKRVDDVRRGTSAARSAGSELESQLQLVRSATSQLIAEVVRMQTLN